MGPYLVRPPTVVCFPARPRGPRPAVPQAGCGSIERAGAVGKESVGPCRSSSTPRRRVGGVISGETEAARAAMRACPW
jgi:hypothetical protein